MSHQFFFHQSADEIYRLEAEINRQIALSMNKKRGPWARYAKGDMQHITFRKSNVFLRVSHNLIAELFPIPDSPTAGPSRLSISSTQSMDQDVDDVIADMTLSAVKECLTPSEAAAVDAATNSVHAASPSRLTDESVLMPPPDATYLQLRHHLSMRTMPCPSLSNRLTYFFARAILGEHGHFFAYDRKRRTRQRRSVY